MDLHALSVAVGEALRDAEAHGAKIAAHVLRVQVPELFREINHRRGTAGNASSTPTTNPPPAATNMPKPHPSNAEIPASPEAHALDNCPVAKEFQVEQGRREVAKWLLTLGTTLALGIGGWAHLRLWTDNDRLTKLETQREAETKALEQRLSTMEGNLSRQIAELREIVLRGRP